MSLSESLTSARPPTGLRALWGFIRDSSITEFWSMWRLLVAPLRALMTGSVEPIKSAMRQAEEDSLRVIRRYSSKAP